MMDTARQHWPILDGLGTDLANKVRSFLVIGEKGNGVLVATEDGQGYWLGEMRFETSETKTATKPTSLDVPGLVSMAHCLFHILLLNKEGKIYSMGRNDRGQLGLGTVNQETHFSPQLIPIPHKFTSVRCGCWHSLALTEDGKVWAWGLNNWGHVGIPSSTCLLSSPCQILKLDPYRVVAVECGEWHSLALTDRGEVYGCGANDCGQVGDGFRRSTHTFTRIPTPSPIKSMAAGHSHTLLLTQTGEVYACGDNEYGQLGLPTDTKSSASLTKIAGLPPISQIASLPATHISIAMSFDLRCFVWGQLTNDTSISTPLNLPPVYSTVESPLSAFSLHRYTSHSVQVPETPPSRLSTRMSQMFDNPEISDVQFVVEQRTIHAHQNILSYSSDYFARMFSERWLVPVDSENPIVKVTIPEYSYQAFRAFLRFLYTDYLEVYPDLFPELFELANLYLLTELQQLCLLRMRITLTPATCCLYYPLTHRHSLPELATFQKELVQFASTRMPEVVDSAAYRSMEKDLRDNLTNAVGIVLGSCRSGLNNVFFKKITID